MRSERGRERTGVLDGLRRGVRQALRQLRRSPGFAAAVVVSLALGIGANTAIFSAVEAALLRPLPYPHADRLAAVWTRNAGRGWLHGTASPADFLDWKAESRAFGGLAAYNPSPGELTLEGSSGAVMVRRGKVTGGLFGVLGVRPELGRTFRGPETWDTTERVALLSDALWRGRFGADPGVVGRLITLDGEGYRVVGVVPPGAGDFLPGVDVWAPVRWDPAARGQPWFRRAHWIRVVGRLAPGVSPDEARADLAGLAARLARQHPETNRGMDAGLTPLHDWMVGSRRTPLLLAFGAVALLLLIACANVANLLLAWTGRRRRETAVRGALGASPARLFGEGILLALVLAALSGLAGLGLGRLGMLALSALRPPALADVGRLRMSGAVLAFTGAAAVLSGLLAASLPALRAARTDPARLLSAGGRRAGSDRGAARLAGGLVAAEVGLALLLVVGAALLGRSLWALRRVDPGFRTADRLSMAVSLPARSYPGADEIVGFERSLLGRLRRLPGVVDAAATTTLPLTGTGRAYDVTIPGRGRARVARDVAARDVSPGYFRTLGVPLLEGRTFRPEDAAGARPAVVVNRAFARRYFPGEDPVGREIDLGGPSDTSAAALTVIGVAGSERQDGLRASPRPEILGSIYRDAPASLHYIVHTKRGGDAVLPLLRESVRSLDPGVAPYDVRTLEEIRSAGLASARFLLLLLGLFAGTASILALVGVFGVTAEAACRRTHELGVRKALGAEDPDLYRLVLGRTLAPAAAGVVLGLGAAALASRVLEGTLYGVRPVDSLTYGAGALALLLAAAAAALLPARRAARLDPLSVLREE